MLANTAKLRRLPSSMLCGSGHNQYHLSSNQNQNQNHHHLIRLLPSSSLSSSTRRSIFSDAKLGITSLKENRELLRKQYLHTKDEVLHRVKYQLESSSNNLDKLYTSSMRKLLVLADTDEEIQLLVSYLKLSIDEKLMEKSEARGVLLELVRLCSHLDKIDFVIDLFFDQTFRPFLGGTYGSLIIMNRLVVEGRYSELLAFFSAQQEGDDYSIAESYSESEPFHLRQKIPRDHLDLVCQALYLQNSAESMKVLKDMCEYLRREKCTLGNKAVQRAFYLAIKQNAPEFAYDLMTRSMVELDAKLNCQMIALCQMDQLNDAFTLANQMLLSLVCIPDHKFTGKFLPLTLVSLREACSRSEFVDVYEQQLTVLMEKIKKYGKNRPVNRLAKFDLVDLCGDESLKRQLELTMMETKRNEKKTNI